MKIRTLIKEILLKTSPAFRIAYQNQVQLANIQAQLDLMNSLLQQQLEKDRINDACLLFIRNIQDDVSRLQSNKYYSQVYRQFETGYWLSLARHIYNQRGNKNVKNVLDIGCAYGTLAAFIKRLFDADVYCVDFTPNYMSEKVIKEFDLHWAINNPEIEPLPWELQFDIILLTEVLEHFNFHPLPTLKKICGLLSRWGMLYLSTPNAKSWGRVTKYYCSLEKIPPSWKSMMVNNSPELVDDHIYVYEEVELLELIDSAGLYVLENFTNEKHLQFVLKKKCD